MKQTTRQQVRDLLELKIDGATPTELAQEVSTEESIVRPNEVLNHLEHIQSSVSSETDTTLLAAPPECIECGFNSFDSLLNIPSRCPDCESLRVSEPEILLETNQ